MSNELPTSEVLYRAANAIEERGWSQGGGWFPRSTDTGPLCLEGGLRAACGYFSDRYTSDAITANRKALGVVRDYLTESRPEFINPHAGYVISFSWNDELGRTASEVIEVLRSAALIEAAKENPTALVVFDAPTLAEAVSQA